MAQSVAVPVSRRNKPIKPSAPVPMPVPSNRRFADAICIAGEQGLLSGVRTLTVRGRMPSRLVEQAKRKTGIQSDSKLIEAALANLVAADDYAEWLLAQRGTVRKDLDLEF